MQVLYQLSYGPKKRGQTSEPGRRHGEAYNGNAPWEASFTSGAKRQRACLEPEPDLQATQSVHTRGLRPPVEP